MPDHNPTLLRRILMLRKFPLLATADLDELATVAENMVEARFAGGALVARSGARVASVQLVIEGRIETNGHAWGPRQVFGALEAFAGRTSTGAVAVTDTHTLALPAHDLGELLEDNFGLLLSALRELASRMVRSAPPSARHVRLASSSLGLVERLILFRQLMPFAGASLHALAALAQRSDEVQWPAGTVVAREGDPAANGLIIVNGTLRTARGDVVDAGASIGHLETLAGLPYATTVETTTAVRALRSSGPAMLDVLEDHTDVGLAMIAAFAGALLDAASRVN